MTVTHGGRTGLGFESVGGTGTGVGVGGGFRKGYNEGGGGVRGEGRDCPSGREGYQRAQGGIGIGIGVGVGELLNEEEIKRMGRGKKRYHENINSDDDSEDEDENYKGRNHTWGLEQNERGGERGREGGRERGGDNTDSGYASLVPEFSVSLLTLVEEATAVTYEHADHRTVVPMTR